MMQKLPQSNERRYKNILLLPNQDRGYLDKMLTKSQGCAGTVICVEWLKALLKTYK